MLAVLLVFAVSVAVFTVCADNIVQLRQLMYDLLRKLGAVALSIARPLRV